MPKGVILICMLPSCWRRSIQPKLTKRSNSLSPAGTANCQIGFHCPDRRCCITCRSRVFGSSPVIVSNQKDSRAHVVRTLLLSARSPSGKVIRAHGRPVRSNRDFFIVGRCKEVGHFRFWSFSDTPTTLTKVRVRRQSGKHLLAKEPFAFWTRSGH